MTHCWKSKRRRLSPRADAGGIKSVLAVRLVARLELSLFSQVKPGFGAHHFGCGVVFAPDLFGFAIQVYSRAL